MPTSGSVRLWMILALALLVTLVCWPSAQVLYGQWTDFVNITFTHGPLILAVCVYLVWRERAAIARAPVQPWPLAQLALAGMLVAWLICSYASIQDLHITIFPAVFWLAIAAAFGWPIARLMFFPVAFFGFALPSWAQLGNSLQELTVLAMQLFLGMTGPNAVISGDTIHIPNGSFVIEEGCSGLHFMIVGLAVAALHGQLRRDPWRTRLGQLVLMAGLALLANWVRVYTVIEAGYLSDMRNYLVSVSHYWFGWGVFAVALVAFFWLSTWFTPAQETSGAPAGTPPLSPAPAAATPLGGFLAAVLVLLVLPGASLLARRTHPPAPLSTAPFLTLTAPWSALTPVGGSFWLPQFEGADDNEYLTAVSPRYCSSGCGFLRAMDTDGPRADYVVVRLLHCAKRGRQQSGHPRQSMVYYGAQFKDGHLFRERVGIIGDVGGTQTAIQYGTVGGSKTTLHSMLSNSSTGAAIKVNGGSASASTYLGSCTSAGAYKVGWAIIDGADPSSGSAPVSATAITMGQAFYGVTPVPNPGYTT